MKVDGATDEIVFANGRRVSANLGVIGLGPDGAIYEGYDGEIFLQESPVERQFLSSQYVDSQELQELCDYMIAAWTKRKETAA